MHKTVALFTGALLALTMTVGAETKQLNEFPLEGFIQDYETAKKDTCILGRPFLVGGKTYGNGVGTHAGLQSRFILDGKVKSFMAVVGLDESTSPSKGHAEFVIKADGKIVWKSGEMRTFEPAKECRINLEGVKELELNVDPLEDGIGYDHANWMEAKFEFDGKAPVLFISPKEEPYILTPPTPETPLLNNAPAYGVRPGHPFLYRIPCTGKRPMKFAAENLPEGLKLDADKGIITGVMGTSGTVEVKLTATNALGNDKSVMTIKGGETISLTPPMGWNSWNCFAGAVTQEKVTAAADALNTSSLAEYGYAYVNIDDFWMNNPAAAKWDDTLAGPVRDEKGFILPNKRFPDMKGLFDHIHSMGLKGGIYSGPGTKTCGSCVASFDHEYLDALQFAEWGVDYLKYDYCFYSPTEETSRTREIDWDAVGIPKLIKDYPQEITGIKPYALMGHALRQSGRDILYSLCQYGGCSVELWGPKVGGNAWRTTGDIIDIWTKVREIWKAQERLYPYGGPGHWNDPDMLAIGPLGWGQVRPCRLTPSEQYTHFTVWSMLNAPLLLGCDLTQLDNFTLNILANREVIAVNQDELGQQAHQVIKNPRYEVWMRDMADGSVVVGVFNLDAEYEPYNRDVTFLWKDLGFREVPGRVRDLWRQKDVKKTADDKGAFTAKQLPRHGCMLLRVWK